VNLNELTERFRSLSQARPQRPGGGATAERHRLIFNAGREDLSLAKLIEAHWDAVAILEEAGKQPVANATYAVWASEIPGKPLAHENGSLRGTKEFCSGAALANRALVTAGSTLVEIELLDVPDRLQIDESGWHTEAFQMTGTAAVSFDHYPVASLIGDNDWYTRRVGFWQGACGPAAAWAGGAAGLVDYAMTRKRDGPHFLAHLGAMHANVSAMETLLANVGDAFDREPHADAMVRALEVRHIIEQLSTDVLRRFARCLGPAPLVKEPEIVRRYAELDLFLRQCHAERDLQTIGNALVLDREIPAGSVPLG
jgi:hypothetical protein